MGLFDFIASAGAKLSGRDEPVPQAQRREVDPAKLEELKRAAGLKRVVETLGFEVEGLRIEAHGDTATIYGKVDNQAEREKVVLAVGNVAGIAHVDDRTEAVHPAPPAVFHTVVAGDTLSKIAKKYLGSATRYPEIFEANRPMLSHPDKIYPGQVLRIPAETPVAAR